MAKKRRVMLFLVEGKSEREALEILISNTVSYTHLDVYKRQNVMLMYNCYMIIIIDINEL